MPTDFELQKINSGMGKSPYDGKGTPSTVVEDAVAPVDAAEALERWNSPRVNMWRYFLTLFSLFMLGMNDAAFGALIPYIEPYYGLSYTNVSLIFLTPFVGYTIAALTNNAIHMRAGQVGIAVLAPTCRIIAYVVVACHPPYPVIPVVLAIAGFGNGLDDAAWNAWVGNMANANELLGFLHGFYGLGATVSPLIATALVTQGRPWYYFYYIMLGLSGPNLIFGYLAFRTATGAAHRAHNPLAAAGEKSHTREAITNRITWLCAAFLLGYVGTEVSIGGWLVTFMLRIRDAAPFNAGLTVTFFWLGLTIGRVTLGFVTGRIGEKLAIAIYLVLCMALELLFWLVPNYVSSTIFSTFLGFFLGPLFPAAIVVMSKLLPRQLHVSAIGFAAAFGGGGAAVLPFAVGAIATARGVQVLQPIILAFLAAILVLWILLPGGLRKRGLDEVRDARLGGNDDAVVGADRGGLGALRRKMGLKQGREVD